MYLQQIDDIEKRLQARKGQRRIRIGKPRPYKEQKQLIETNPESSGEFNTEVGKIYSKKLKPILSNRPQTTTQQSSRMFQYPDDLLEMDESDMPVKLSKIKSKDKITKFYRPRYKSEQKEHYKEPTAASRMHVKDIQLTKNKSEKRICSVHCLSRTDKKKSRSHNYINQEKGKLTERKHKKAKKYQSIDTIQNDPQDECKIHNPKKEMTKYLQSMQVQQLLAGEKGIMQFPTYFGLQPQFYKLQTQYVHQFYEKSSQKIQKRTESFKIHDIPRMPGRQNLVEFIEKYTPYDNKIRISRLIREDRFYIEYSQNQIYFGQRAGNERQGIGILLTEKSCFEGLFSNGFKVHGTEVTASGIYNGQFYNDKRQGKGQYKSINREMYIGDWKDGHRHGNGVWTNSKGQSYNGQWVRGKCCGEGVYKTYGKQYHGDFFDFRKDGWGREIWMNGDKYEGGFKENLPEGKGVYTWVNGTKYQGQFVKGFRNGKGILSTLDGFIYKGQFFDEKPQGKCKIITPFGDRYIGSFREGKKNGRGILILGKGKDVMDGYWQNDKFLSRGKS